MESGDPDCDMVAYASCFHEGEKLHTAGAYEKAISFYSRVRTLQYNQTTFFSFVANHG